MLEITKKPIQTQINTEFKANSRFCFCIMFGVNDYDIFIRDLYDLMVSIDKDSVESDHFEKPLSLHLTFPFNKMLKKFSLEIRDVKSLEDNRKHAINFLSKKLEEEISQEESERIKMDIKLLEDDLIKESEDLKIPKGRIRIELRTSETTDENHIKKTFEINTETKILEVIEENSKKEFDFNLCGFLKLDKNKYGFTQGFELGQQTVFSKETMEKLGHSKISGISFSITKSPVGLKKMHIGEEEDSITFDLEIEFKSNHISNLNEKITSFFEITNSFFREV